MNYCRNCGNRVKFYVGKIKSDYICWRCNKPMEILIILAPELPDFDMCTEFDYEKPDNIIDIAKNTA